MNRLSVIAKPTPVHISNNDFNKWLPDLQGYLMETIRSTGLASDAAIEYFKRARGFEIEDCLISGNKDDCLGTIGSKHMFAVYNVSRRILGDHLSIIHATNQDIILASGFIRLRSLSISGQADNIEPLTNLVNLTGLTLALPQLCDILPLASLTKLTTLDLSGTHVSDVAPLAALGQLNTLKLERTPVTDVRSLDGMRNLASLYLEGSQVPHQAPGLTLPSLEPPNGRLRVVFNPRVQTVQTD
jgi:Leucine-rich repeat (LRR) protein